MACIGCGLALNSDGKGRVDIDTEGGLECQGVGDGGTTNTANNGLAIKVNPAEGNSLQVNGSGVFVPRSFNFEPYTATVLGGAVSNPNFTGGGAAFFSPSCSISITNPSTVLTKRFFVVSSIDYSVTDASAGYWIELATQDNGGGWTVKSSQVLQADAVISPLTQHPTVITVNPGASYTYDARMHLYTGHIGAYRLTVSAWGGYVN